MANNNQEVNQQNYGFETTVIRDNGRIVRYDFVIYHKAPQSNLQGSFSTEEMQYIYSSYATSGMNMTCKQVSERFFYTTPQMASILRAFGITKAGSWLAPHIVEKVEQGELTQEDIDNLYSNIQRRKYEKSVERRLESLTQNNLKKVISENKSLKENIRQYNNVNFNVPKTTTFKVPNQSTNSMILYLSDLHIGCWVDEGLYDKNFWNQEALHRRLESLLQKVLEMGTLDSLIVCLMGDMLDGMNNSTARGGHFLPQNYTNKEQYKVFMEEMIWFINTLYEMNIANELKIYSVPNGNHTEVVEYVAVNHLKTVIESTYPNVEFTIFEDFLGHFYHKDKCYIICHGKDGKNMKRGWPLNLNSDTKDKIYDYIINNNLNHRQYEVVKGDLHCENVNTSYKINYRTVASLMGSSAHSQINYPRVNYGVSYDFFIGNNITRGVFIDL